MMKQVTGIIGWIGTALVFGALGIRLFRPELFEQYGRYLIMAGLVCILIYMLGQWRDVVTFYGRRQARYGTISIIGILVAVGIFAAVNYLGVRQTKRWDLTENQAYSLSDQSVKILQQLDEPVQFTVYDQETNFARFRERLDVYAYESKNVKVEYVDVDRQPARAKQAEITTYGTVVASYKGREQRLNSTGEQDVTNALIKLVAGKEKKVYFTQGHGERDTTSADRLRGYNAITQALTRDNFTVTPLPLIQQKEVPDDATVVVIAGPTTDFLQPEIDALKRYIAKGGKVLALIDPPAAGAADPANLIAFLKEWSIEFGNDIVVDASGMGQLFGGDASVPVVVSYPAHPITDGFRVMTAFPLARSTNAAQGGARSPQPLLETSQQSWAETDLKGLASGEVQFNDGGDRRGPITLGLAVSAPATETTPPAGGNASPDAPKPESRLVAIGDSDFAGNNALGVQGNQDFFLNTINWLAQQENLIAIRPRDAQDRRLTLTADQQQRIFIFSVFLIPALVFAGGVWVWWKRR